MRIFKLTVCCFAVLNLATNVVFAQEIKTETQSGGKLQSGSGSTTDQRAHGVGAAIVVAGAL